MARPALSAARSVEVIDFLAAFPGRGFTLSEIVRGTGINVSSCHAVLTALAERGYLARCAERRYRLGRALVAAGQVALDGEPLVRHAVAAARLLFDEVAVPTLLTTVIGDEVLALAAHGGRGDRSAGLRVGERMPLVPPVGAPFLAWSDEAAIGAWLARGGERAEDPLSRHWRQNLATIRARGFQIALRGDDSSRLAERIDAMAAGAGMRDYKDQVASLIHAADRHLLQPDTIEPDARYDVLLLAAPIFDHAGCCILNLCLSGFDEPITGAAILAYTDRMVRLCLQVMHADRDVGTGSAGRASEAFDSA